MSNLSTLNTALFSQLEKLENATGDQLKQEMHRAKVMADIGKTIIQNGQLVLQAQRYSDDFEGATPSELPLMLTGGTDAKG